MPTPYKKCRFDFNEEGDFIALGIWGESTFFYDFVGWKGFGAKCNNYFTLMTNIHINSGIFAGNWVCGFSISSKY